MFSFRLLERERRLFKSDTSFPKEISDKNSSESSELNSCVNEKSLKENPVFALSSCVVSKPLEPISAFSPRACASPCKKFSSKPEYAPPSICEIFCAAKSSSFWMPSLRPAFREWISSRFCSIELFRSKNSFMLELFVPTKRLNTARVSNAGKFFIDSTDWLSENAFAA